ncbi:MAG: SNF2 helicase-associated domain-containing protein [Ilumatobacteraceae bacterium]
MSRDGTTPRSPTASSAGSSSTSATPVRGRPAVRLDLFGAAVWLSETPSGDQLSPSLAWFAQLTQFAVRLVAARRLVPEVVDEGPFTVARWRPVLDDVHEQAIAHAAASAPPICRNGSSATTGDIVSALVDGLSRAVLHHAGWKPDLGRKRSVEIQAARGVFAALGKPDPVIRSGSDEFARAVAETASVLDRHRRRLAGEPVVRGRVRLTLPNDAHDPWLIDLELVDDADPGRWCTVADLQDESARALDLAGGSPARLGALREEAERLVTAVADAVPMLEEVGAPDHDGHVELDIDEADDFIEQAPLQLEQANIELIGPEHLVRAKVSVKGTAREGPTDDRRSRFGKEALVEWEAVIDETPISMADLERAEAAGVSLLRTGHRWVRIDTAALRKARKTLSEQVEEQSSISALELLRLMSGAGGDDDLPIELELADDLPTAPTIRRGCRRVVAPRTRRRSARRPAAGDDRGRRVRRRAAPLPAASPVVDAVPGPHRSRRLSRRRHGPRQDGHHVGPPARTAGAAPRGVSAQRRAQLGGRGAPVHPRAAP